MKPLLRSPIWQDLVDLAHELAGFPRHIGQHVGGVVISAEPLSSVVPVEPARMDGRYVCQWDKDSVDDARFVKIDFLALGMLSAVDECLDIVEEVRGARVDLGRIPHDSKEIYASIQEGDTMGVFQIESRAQIQTLPRTRPKNIDDLAVQVAIIRPGPIVAGAFHPYMEYREKQARGEPSTSTTATRSSHHCWKIAWRRRSATCSTRTRCCRSPARSRASPPDRPTSLRRAMSRKRFVGGHAGTGRRVLRR